MAIDEACPGDDLRDGPRSGADQLQGPGLTAEEVARVQAVIDAGTVWSTVEGGRFAMKLIDSGRCKRAPGVLTMWRENDDRYRPIYSQAERRGRLTTYARFSRG